MKSINTANERAKRWYVNNKYNPAFIERRNKNSLDWRKANPKKYLLQHARHNAKERGQICSIVEEDLIIPEECPVFKVPFQYGTPYTLSIDRIDSKQGYVKNNIQIISRKANMMKQDATPEELRKFANWVLNQSPV